MVGNMEEFSEQQRESISKFRTRVEDVLAPKHDDYYLVRWLKARNWNINKAEKMFRDSMKWRQKVGADTVLQDWKLPEVIRKYYPGGLFGFDKEGNPIWIETLGRSDPKGLLHSAKKAQFIKYKIHSCELIYKNLDEQAQKLGAKERGLIIIFDLDKYGMKHLWKPAVDLYSEILTMYEANYPDTLKKCYVIHAPKIFPIAYSLVKPFLSEETKTKIQVLGSNWKEKILEVIDPDQLPVHWGGTATDPDGDIYCKSKVCMGGEVPKSYYLSETLDHLEDFTTLTVGRAAMHQLEEIVSEPGSLLMWQFTSAGKDIGFGVFMKTANCKQKIQDMKVIIPIERVYSHMVPEDGSLRVEKIGTYVIVFDNSYSWISAKKITYDIKVIPPSNMKELEVNASYVASGDHFGGSKSDMGPVTSNDSKMNSSTSRTTVEGSKTNTTAPMDSSERSDNRMTVCKDTLGRNKSVPCTVDSNPDSALESSSSKEQNALPVKSKSTIEPGKLKSAYHNGDVTSEEHSGLQDPKPIPACQTAAVVEDGIHTNYSDRSDFETDDEGATCV